MKKPNKLIYKIYERRGYLDEEGFNYRNYRTGRFILAEFLLEKGYEVHGITRRASISNTARIDHL